MEQHLGRRYWITSVGDDRNKGLESRDSAQGRLKALLNVGWYLFAQNTPGRKRMKPGDQLCFYLKGVGVVARAELGEPVEYPPAEVRKFIRVKFNCPFRLRSSQIFLEHPVRLDLPLRSGLEAFEQRNPKNWQWFVQMTHEVSAHDFALIARANSEDAAPAVKPLENL